MNKVKIMRLPASGQLLYFPDRLR